MTISFFDVETNLPLTGWRYGSDLHAKISSSAFLLDD
jgi:hypothetical protein